MTPFQMSGQQGRQNPALLPLIWSVSYLSTVKHRLKIHKYGMQGLKPPYVVLSMHQGFMDYYITPQTLFPRRAVYVSDMEGFANYGKWLYSQIGCIGTRRFTNDPVLISNIRRVVEQNKQIIVIYPEARHCNVGTNAVLPDSIGKLVKRLKLPVVIQKLKGSYLCRPNWDEGRTRKGPIEATLEKVLEPETIAQMDASALTERINRYFTYDEYRWQYENRIKIDDPDRAQGLHKVLYRCPACGREDRMQSCGYTLTCDACGRSWVMDEYGRMAATMGETEFAHIPHWYEYQRAEVKKEIAQGDYRAEIPVFIHALPNEKGFVHLGTGTLIHNAAGFRLCFDGDRQDLFFSSRAMWSVHTEYDYREKGDCIVLSTRDCCYYLHNQSLNLNVTKIQLAAEALYEQDRKIILHGDHM